MQAAQNARCLSTPSHNRCGSTSCRSGASHICGGCCPLAECWLANSRIAEDTLRAGHDTSHDCSTTKRRILCDRRALVRQFDCLPLRDGRNVRCLWCAHKRWISQRYIALNRLDFAVAVVALHWWRWHVDRCLRTPCPFDSDIVAAHPVTIQITVPAILLKGYQVRSSGRLHVCIHNYQD